MILKNLITYSFTGISNRTFEFKDGLNVIVGPNESGKSSLIEAILGLLFVSQKPTKREFDFYVKRWIPIGSDYARVKADFKFKDLNECTLEKRWGSDSYANMPLNLEELLPCSEGVFRKVLCSKQGELDSVFESLVDNEIVKNLGDVVRASILSSSGVSIESFMLLVSERIEHLYTKWDINLDAPELKNRGGVYTKGTGEIYDLFYQIKTLEEKLFEASNIEEKLRRCDQSLAALEKEKLELERYFVSNQELHDSYKRQGELLEKERRLKSDEVILRKNYQEWISLQTQIVDYQREQIVAKNRAAALESEKNLLIKELDLIREVVSSQVEIEANVESRFSLVNDDSVKTILMNQGEKIVLDLKRDGELEIGSLTIRAKNSADKRGKDKQTPIDLQKKLKEVFNQHSVQSKVFNEFSFKLDLARKKISELESCYNGPAKLLDKIVEVKNSLNELSSKILKPSGGAGISIQQEIENYKVKELSLKQIGSKITSLMVERVNYSSQVLDESAEELGKTLSEARSQFDKLKKEGVALQKIKNVSDEIRIEIDSDCYTPVIADFFKAINKLTNNRYIGHTLNDKRVSLVSSVETKEGQRFPIDWLSTGAKDSIALGLKLVLSKYFLGPRKGIIFFDDSFVDLDEQRRAVAFELIRELGEKKQVLFFTCHQHIVNELNGNLIKIT